MLARRLKRAPLKVDATQCVVGFGGIRIGLHGQQQALLGLPPVLLHRREDSQIEVRGVAAGIDGQEVTQMGAGLGVVLLPEVDLGESVVGQREPRLSGQGGVEFGDGLVEPLEFEVA